jgi:hypothetical protein
MSFVSFRIHLPVTKFGNSNDSEQDNKNQYATKQNKIGSLWQIKMREVTNKFK